MQRDSLNREIKEDREAYRDTITSITEDGNRNWVYAKKPTGRYTNAREAVAIALLTIFFTGPFIKIGGQPLLMLNVVERKFVIFGTAFFPADFHLLALGGLSLLLFVALFTAVFGRIWCGWACPQTIFLEMVFRKIEYWIEGDRSEQIRRDKGPWIADKVIRKVSKHAIYFALSFTIANLFLAYVIGYEALWNIITDPPSKHLMGLSIITLFSFVFYMVFARFREQVCHFACPYGRHQSLMIDEDSLSVAYDFVRGEQRGSTRDRKLNAATAYGDCIDCHECVRVCPMGIDIRNGIQLECVQCTACIDACDHIMDKINKPRGLVRYSSLNGIKNETKKFITPRIIAYSVVLTIVFALFITFLSIRPDTESIILRTPGVLFSTLEQNKYSNMYNVTVLNKTNKTMPVEVRVTEPAGAELRLIGDFSQVGPQTIKEGKFLLILPGDQLSPTRTRIEFAVFSGDKELERVKSSFIGPEQPYPSRN